MTRPMPSTAVEPSNNKTISFRQHHEMYPPTIGIHTRTPRLYKVILPYELRVLAFAPGFSILGQFVTFIEVVMWRSGNALDVQILERTPADPE